MDGRFNQCNSHYDLCNLGESPPQNVISNLAHCGLSVGRRFVWTPSVPVAERRALRENAKIITKKPRPTPQLPHFRNKNFNGLIFNDFQSFSCCHFNILSLAIHLEYLGGQLVCSGLFIEHFDLSRGIQKFYRPFVG